jgi:hypothetical protein
MRLALAAGCSLVVALATIPACSCSQPGAGGMPHRDAGRGADGGGGTGDDTGTTSGMDTGTSTGTDGGTTMGSDAGPGCGPREICDNGIDDNCDGRADEGCSCAVGQTQACYSGSSTVAGVGSCRRGQQTCEASGEFSTWGTCVGETAPGIEVCDGSGDEDCDGVVDEGCGCPLGTMRDCYTGESSTNGVGPCHGGTQTCVAMGATTDWTICSGEVTPQPELCDGMDYDCDGMSNTGCVCAIGTTRSCYDGPGGTSGVGICHDGAETCVAAVPGPGAMWGGCMGEVTPQTDMCDGIDYTCTGVPGAGCACILGTTRACYGGPPATRGVGRCHDGTNTCVSGPTWSPTCTSEQQPVTEICANGQDDNCNGVVDEGCGGTLMCPGHLTVNAGDPITLSAIASGISTYSWRIVSGPTGGAAVSTWSPTPPTAMTEVFTPGLVGDYLIEITGTDAGGHVVTCQFTVTALPHGLRVQLTWNGTGDLDLHMHNQTTTSPWFSSPNDCYYADRTPAWLASLDFDNTSQNGPENISMDNPVVGQSYTIAVHNYSSGAGRTATVQIFCGSTTSTVPNATFMSRALAGTTAGNCTSNDFWTVARVTFTAPTTCTITTLNTYRASSTACTTF